MCRSSPCCCRYKRPTHCPCCSTTPGQWALQQPVMLALCAALLAGQLLAIRQRQAADDELFDAPLLIWLVYRQLVARLAGTQNAHPARPGRRAGWSAQGSLISRHPGATCGGAVQAIRPGLMSENRAPRFRAGNHGMHVVAGLGGGVHRGGVAAGTLGNVLMRGAMSLLARLCSLSASEISIDRADHFCRCVLRSRQMAVPPSRANAAGAHPAHDSQRYPCSGRLARQLLDAADLVGDFCQRPGWCVRPAYALSRPPRQNHAPVRRRGRLQWQHSAPGDGLVGHIADHANNRLMPDASSTNCGQGYAKRLQDRIMNLGHFFCRAANHTRPLSRDCTPACWLTSCAQDRRGWRFRWMLTVISSTDAAIDEADSLCWLADCDSYFSTWAGQPCDMSIQPVGLAGHPG